MQKEAAKGELPARSRITYTINRALRDEECVVQLWTKAKSLKRQRVDEFLFGPRWEEEARKLLGPLERYPETYEKAILNLRREIKKNLVQESKPFGRLVSYKPLDLLKAWLVEAWIPPTELFLQACHALGNHKRNSTYKFIIPSLQQMGFKAAIFGFLDPHQVKPLRYLLLSTPRSLAIKCVAYRSYPGGPYPKLLDEEDLNVAHARIFPANSRRKSSAITGK